MLKILHCGIIAEKVKWWILFENVNFLASGWCVKTFLSGKKAHFIVSRCLLSLFTLSFWLCLGGWWDLWKSACAALAQICIYSISAGIVQHLKSKQNENQIQLNVIQLPFSLWFSTVNGLLVISHWIVLFFCGLLYGFEYGWTLTDSKLNISFLLTNCCTCNWLMFPTSPISQFGRKNEVSFKWMLMEILWGHP